MTTPETITAASNGNLQAAQFLTVFARRAHLLDDLVDRDKPVTGEQLAQAEWDWLVVLTGNPFFLAHKDRLMGVIAGALNAWLDSNVAGSFAPSPVAITRDVLKGQWHDVLRLVALLTGGWQALRELSPCIRDYDWEVPLRKQSGAALANAATATPDLKGDLWKCDNCTKLTPVREGPWCPECRGKYAAPSEPKHATDPLDAILDAISASELNEYLNKKKAE